MKIYHGKKLREFNQWNELYVAEVRVEVHQRGQRMYDLPAPNWRYESYEWGYGGAGPRNLAIALMCDASGETLTDEQIMWGPSGILDIAQDFKSIVTAPIMGDEWTLTDMTVLAVMGKLINEQETRNATIMAKWAGQEEE